MTASSGLRAAIALMIALTLAACGTAATQPGARQASPFVAPAPVPERPEELVIVIPGALTSLGAFGPVFGWADRRTAVVGYRFPGLDGMPRTGPVDIRAAGAEIARFVSRREPRRVTLIGFSTGAAIALEAAALMPGRKVQVAAVSAAQPAPAALGTIAAGLGDTLRAVARARSLEGRRVWSEYNRALVFGRAHFGRPREAERSRRMAEASAARLITPGRGLLRDHSANLLTWTLPDPGRLSHARIVMFHGTEDIVFSLHGARVLAGRLPDATLYAYPEAGHLLFVARPRLYDDLRRTLRPWQ
ncbi:MAG: alpha/beta fold hydrolase [Gemmobacter sp.]